MQIFIDCEWNSYGGDLISVALCAADGQEFYEVLPCPKPDPWVAENVMPILGKEPTTLAAVQHSMQRFLAQFACVHVVADWPEDIERFCRLLVTGPGTRLDTPPLTMEVVRVDVPSQLPHNALWDARAIRDHLTANPAISG